jgi:hypothetical protein
VITADNDNMTAAGSGSLAEKTVIQFLGFIAWRGRIKNITGHKQNIDLLLPDTVIQPVKKGGKLIVALASVQRTPQVPVGCMKNVHDRLSGREKETFLPRFF